MEKRKKIIIDTDIGDDIDDAFALCLAMSMNFDIIGITTVFKNTVQRAQITKKLLNDYGLGYEKVPVLAGYGSTLGSCQKDSQQLCQYSDDIESFSPDSSNEDDAVDFIIDSCRKYGNELTVIALGPFTNIAKVIQKDKNALSLVDKVVIMGGAFYRQYADWNVMCDPEAAKIVFDALDNLECMGADVTHKLGIGKENSERILSYSGKSNALSYLSRLYSYWHKETGGIAMLHDPLAIYYTLDPTICKMERAHVTVFTEGLARGLTFNTGAYGKAHMNDTYKKIDSSPRTLVAKEVQSSLFVEIFMKMFDK